MPQTGARGWPVTEILVTGLPLNAIAAATLLPAVTTIISSLIVIETSWFIYLTLHQNESARVDTER